MTIGFNNVNNGGANAGNSPYPCSFATDADNELVVLCMMSNVNNFFGAVAPRTVLSVTDNVATTSGGAIPSLTWQRQTQLLGTIDVNGCFMSGEIWTARAPKKIAKNGPGGLTQAFASWTVASGGGTCSMLMVSLSGLNINAPLDPGSTPGGFARFGVNMTGTQSQPALSGFDQANLNDMALLFYMTDDARADFSAPTLPSGTPLTHDNEEGVGVARSRTGLQYSYQPGPAHTPSFQAGVAVGPWLSMGLLFSDGTTPPPIFRARPFIIQ